MTLRHAFDRYLSAQRFQLSVAFACLCFLNSPVQSATYFIAADGSGDYPNIQSAINVAVTGDTVLLGDGVFTGTSNWNLSIGVQDIVITSLHGRDSTIIDCGGGSGGNQRGILVYHGNSSGTVIDGISIRNAVTGGNPGAGIYITNGSTPIIRNCAIYGNRINTSTTGSGAGIYIGGSNAIISNNLIYDNSFSGAAGLGAGIYVYDCSPVISGNTIELNYNGGGGAGICIVSDSMANVTNNTIRDNSCSVGSGGGILIYQISTPAAHRIRNNLIVDNSAVEGGGIYVSSGSAVVSNCTVASNAGGGLYATTGFVYQCIFIGNTGYQIATSPSVTHSWVEGGFAGVGNITGVTLDFESGPLGDYYLPLGHECVDAGYDHASVTCFEDGFTTRCLDSFTTHAKQPYDDDTADMGFHYARVPWTYYVPDDFARIKSGLDTLMTADSLIVRAGTYYESDVDFYGDGIALVSEDGPEVTTIHADSYGRVLRIRSGEGPETVIDGFTLRDGWSTSYGGGVYCGGSDPTIKNCIITLNNSVTGGGGMYCASSQATISNCIFWSNTVSGGDDVGGGLYVSGTGSDVTIDNCTFYGNTATQGAGIHALGGTTTIVASVIACNITGEGVYVAAPATVSLEYSDIYRNDGGDWLPPLSALLGVNGNRWVDPVFCDAKNGNFALSDVSPCLQVPAQYGQMGARPDGCTSTTYLLQANGSGDFATIQDAVDALNGGDIIELADGTYTGTGNRDVGFKTKSITVKSQNGNPETCIIDCQGASGDPHRAFVISEREGSRATISALTIQNGYHGSGGGAGIQIHRSNPTVRGCVIRDCEAFDGGGLATYASESLISNCQFIDNIANNAGGGLINHTSDPTIEYCLFDGNWALWGGGGLYNHYSSPTVRYCTFVLNSSDHWGGALHNNHPDSTPGIYNCTFVYNDAPSGGAIYSRNNANPSIVNSIIAFSTQGVAAMCASGAVTDLYCSDVFGNAGGDYVDCLSGQLGVSDNFTADPLFCDSSAVDYRLQGASLCAPENNLSCGLVGARPVGCLATGVVTTESVPAAYRLRHVYPNPFNPQCTIQYELPESGHVVLEIYAVTGTRVRTLVDRWKEKGVHKRTWDGRGDGGSELASGIYFYRIVAGDFTATRKAVLLR